MRNSIIAMLLLVCVSLAGCGNPTKGQAAQQTETGQSQAEAGQEIRGGNKSQETGTTQEAGITQETGTTQEAGITNETETTKEAATDGMPKNGLTVEITEENYQSLFQLAPEYSYVGIGYYKAPEDLLGREAFLDAYLPYGEQLEYEDDGRTIKSQAHGMMVKETMTYSDGTAKDVVEQAYQAMVSQGTDFYSEGVSETMYDENYGIAVKQVLYFEENGTKPRVAFLYADPRKNGYYLYAQITYLPEQYDEEQSGLLRELSDVFALNLPDIPAMEP